MLLDHPNVQLIIVFALVLSGSLNAQSIEKYKPLLSDDDLRNTYTLRIQNDLKSIKQDLPREYKKELKEYYEGRAESLQHLAKYDHFVFDADWIKYLNGLKEKVAKANPSFDLSNIDLLIARYYWPNAFAVGEGTVAVNVGLIPFLECEDQLVFILCHEFSHDLLDHSEQKLRKRLEVLNSSEFNQEVKEIEESEYHQATKLKKLLKKNLFSQRAHSREYESAADSLAFILYLNTSYKPMQAALTMDVLELMNEHYDSSYVDIFTLLNTERVTSEYKSSIAIRDEDYDVSEEEVEKFQTHPDCADRKAWLMSQIDKESKSMDETFTASPQFEQLKRFMTWEMCESYLHFNRYDRALITSLRLLQQDNESEYLAGVAGYSYYKLIKARKDYELNSIAPLPHKNVDSIYSQVLDVIYLTRMRTLQRSAQWFCSKRFEPKSSDERLIFAYAQLSEMNEEEELYAELLKIYRTRFPNGKFIENFDVE